MKLTSVEMWPSLKIGHFKTLIMVLNLDCDEEK
jgi:hypothetical protein